MSQTHLNVQYISSSRQRPFALITVSLLVLSMMLSAVWTGPALAQGAKPASPLAADLDATFAVDWMRLFYDRVKADTVNAPGAGRVYAYAGVTLYESVAPGIPG